MTILSELVYWFTIKPYLWKLQRLLPEAKIHPTGSRYICDPPVMNTDIDFLIYTEKCIDEILIIGNFKKTPFVDYVNNSPVKFDAWRKGKINLIVTSTLEYTERFQTATYICKMENIKNKWARVCIHEALRHNCKDYYSIPKQLHTLLKSFNGPYGNVLHQAYRAKHGLKL